MSFDRWRNMNIKTWSTSSSSLAIFHSIGFTFWKTDFHRSNRNPHWEKLRQWNSVNIVSKS
jgi:hypothetical protein